MAIKKGDALYKPETKEERYLHYLLTGEGDLESLPAPSTIEEQYLYHMCVNGVKVTSSEGGSGVAGQDGKDGEQGPQGETGPAGADGQDGEDGTKWTVGASDPVAESGKVGDLHLNTTSWTVHNKTEGGWINLGSIRGPQGPQGVAGKDGTTTVVQGASQPQQPQTKTIKYLDIVANSDAGKQNYLSAIYNATNNKATGQVKARYKVKLKEKGTTEKPALIGIRLFANNTNDTGIAGGYNVAKDNIITNPEYDKEYIVEATFENTNNLNTYNYLKPFLVLNQTTSNKLITHALEVYEAVIIVNGKEYDIFNTVDVWGNLNGLGTKKEATKEVPVESVEKVKYLDIVANSGSFNKNFLCSIYDASASKTNTVEVKYVVKLKEEGSSEVPKSLGIKMFANNVNDKNDITVGFTAVEKEIVTEDVKYGGEYEVKATFEGLQSFNYIKPYLVLNKVTNDTAPHDIAHALEVHEAKVIVGGKEHDILNSVDVWGKVEGGKSSRKEVEKEVPVATSNVVAPQVVAKPYLPWEGKTYAIIGDSIVYGLDGQTRSGRVAKPHPTTTGELCGFAKVNNYGISSSTITTNPKVSNWNNARNPMVLRYQNMEDADVIAFAGGINDYWLDVPLGTFDPASEDTTNFYGGLNVLFKGLIEKYPTKPIFVMTVLDYVAEGDTGANGNANGNTLEEWRNAVRKVAQYYSIPVYDIGNELGITTAIESQKNALMPDGLHPNQAGYDIMGRKIANYINYRL